MQMVVLVVGWIKKWPWFGQISLLAVSCLVLTILAHCWLVASFLWSLALIAYVALGIGVTFWTVSHLSRLLLSATVPVHSDKCLKWLQSWGKATLRIMGVLGKGRVSFPEAYIIGSADSLDDDGTVQEELHCLSENVVQDFVHPWYKYVGSSQDAPREVEAALEKLLKNFSLQLQRLQKQLFSRKVLLAFHIHFQEYLRSLRRAAKRRKSSKMGFTFNDTLRVEAHFKYSHQVVKDSSGLHCHIRRICQILIDYYGPPELQQSTAGEFLAAIVADKVFIPALQTVSNPSWLNKSILQVIELGGNLCPNVVAKESEAKSSEVAPQSESQDSEANDQGVFPEFEKVKNGSAAAGKKAKLEKEAISRGSVSNSRASTTTFNLPLSAHLPSSSEVSESSTTICDVLGGLIPATAGPLLPEQAMFRPRKMWISPTIKSKDFPETAATFGKTKTFLKLPTDPNIPIPSSTQPQEKSKILKCPSLPSIKMSLSQLESETRIAAGVKALSHFISPTKELAPRPLLERSVSMVLIEDGDHAKKSSKLVSEELVGNSTRECVESDSSQCNDKLKTYDLEKADYSRSPTPPALFSLEGEPSSQGNEKNAKSELVRSPGHISPVYEEAEDFASTIAKLRALLEQRDSTQSLLSQSSQGSKSSPRSAGCDSTDSSKGQFTFALQDSIGDSPREGSLDSERPTKLDMIAGDSESSDSVDIVEASELPTDGRLFVNLTISKTEVHNDVGGGQFTVYCIQYDGIYMNDSEQSGADVSEPRLVLHPVHVKRRFREFLALQSSLEENSILKPLMKGIKGPTKWLNLPFSKMDQTTVSHRRHFLETYLQHLCLRPQLADSEELREFLAYGSKAPSIYGHKSPEMLVPRIDKILAKTVTGMFNTLKTALPSFESISPNYETVPAPPEISKKGEDRKILSQIFSSAGNRVEVVEIKLNFEPKDGMRDGLEDTISHHLKTLESLRHVLGEMTLARGRNSMEVQSCEASLLSVDSQEHRKESSESAFEDDQDQMEAHLPLATTLLNLLADLFPHQGNWQSQEFVVASVKILLGRLLEVWMKNECESLLSEEAQAQYLHQLRLLLWPQELLNGSENVESEQLEEVPASQVVAAVLKKIPSLVQWLVGPYHLREGVRLGVDLLQHPSLTLDFALTVIDLLLTHCLTDGADDQ